MKKQFIALSMGVGALILATQHAFAQQAGRNCADRARVLAQLTEKYGEARQGMGLAANNTVVEVFASQDTGTWTITVTSPNGMTCLVASGQAYEEGVDDLVPTSGEDT